MNRRAMSTIWQDKKGLQLELKNGNPLKISGKGGTSGKHRRKKS
jgi:hypothetical protein